MKVTIEVYIEKEEFGYRATIGLNSAFGATINEALHRAVDQAFPGRGLHELPPLWNPS